MSGHSHFSSIKHKKALTDAKRGKIFSKLSREISVIAKEKGGNPETNSSLKMVIEKAKNLNLPKDNIERAIKKGTGELEGVKLEQFLFEAYGPGGIAIIIEGITDNRNRSLTEIKQILSKHQGKLAREGSVKWLFEKKGVIILDSKAQDEKLKNKENLELLAIDSGAEDIYWHNDILDIYTKPDELEKIRKTFEQAKIIIDSISLAWVAKENIELDQKIKTSAEKLFFALDENEDIQEIYSNLD